MDVLAKRRAMCGYDDVVCMKKSVRCRRYEQPMSDDRSMGFHQTEIETTNSERESGRSDR